MRWAAALLLCLCAGGFGVAGVLNQSKILDAVNAKLPAKERFPYFGWHSHSHHRLITEYRRLYPSGRLVFRQGILAALMYGCVTVATPFLGFGVLGLVWRGGFLVFLLWRMYFRAVPNP